jgi:hypothetical protein
VKEFAKGAAKHWFKHAIKKEPREPSDLRERLGDARKELQVLSGELMYGMLREGGGNVHMT